MNKFLSLIVISLSLTGCAELGTALNAALDAIPSAPVTQNNGDNDDMMSDEFDEVYHNRSKQWCNSPRDCKKKGLGFDRYVYFEGYLTNAYTRTPVGHVGNNLARAAWKASVCQESNWKTNWKSGCDYNTLVKEVERLEEKRHDRYGIQYYKIFTKDI